MEQFVIDALNQKEQPREIQELMQRCKSLVKMSRQTMKDYYPGWDSADRVYRGERYVDMQDKKAVARGEPTKVVVPLSYSQIQTFVAFCTMMYTQRDYFYELGGSGIEDEQAAKLAQAVLERDLDYNKFKGVLLPQWLTDVGRFGLGIFKSDWYKKTTPAMQQVPDPKWKPAPGMPMQAQPPMITQYVPETAYLGNRITVVNPFRWFPDVRLPITRYREGEFCADETEYAKEQLMQMQADGACAGVEDIPMVTESMLEDRRSPVLNRNYIVEQANLKEKRYVLITEVEIMLNPSKVKIDGDKVLNEQITTEVPCLVWIANDSRIVKIEDGGYEHNEFLYDASQFFNDQNRILNFGLAELLGPSQDILDWLMNSRIANVRKVIQNQLVVDPRFIDAQDLKDRNPIIRLKSTAAVGLSLNSYIQQLNVTDVTTGHIADMQNVSGFAKEATGISENLLGQYASGRRSAREASNVSSNAAARLQVVAMGLWQSGLLPLGKKMLSNLQQGLDDQQLVRIVGLERYIINSQPGMPGPTGQPTESPVRQFLPVDKSQLVGTYDFMIFDATLPSQRAQTAATLQELLIAMSKNPMLVQIFGYDPKLLLDEILQLRNVRNAERFRLTPDRAQQFMLMAGGQPNAGGPPSPGGSSGGQSPTSGTAPAQPSGQSEPHGPVGHPNPGQPK